MEILIVLVVLFVVALLAILIGSNQKPNSIPKQSTYKRTYPKTSSRRTPQYSNQKTSTAHHPPPPEIPASRKLAGKAWVIDGDTIVVNKIKIRLAGIDAPELDQPWGQKSKWEMVRICKGQTLHIELSGETSFDRLIGTCYLPDGRDIGAEIVKAGLALDGGYFS
ncbi:MAG: hypothetical protein GY945_10615, partial [Rhodobacteraceae bacterium]|nr:hypothetical protein [Paracoccaceae bacterium]